MTAFQIVFAPLCGIVAALVLWRVASGRFSLWKGGLWGAMWILGGLLILRPNVTTVAASYVGVGRGTDLVLYVGSLFGLFLFQRLYARTRRLENLLTEVVRGYSISTAVFGDIPDVDTTT